MAKKFLFNNYFGLYSGCGIIDRVGSVSCGVRIETTVVHQIWCPWYTKSFTVYGSWLGMQQEYDYHRLLPHIVVHPVYF